MKKILIALPAVALAALLGLSACSGRDAAPADEMSPTAMSTDAMEKPSASPSDKMDKSGEGSDDKMDGSGDSSMDSMNKAGAYISWADYQKDMAKYAKAHPVLFFHASWCPNCRELDEAVTANASLIPDGYVLVKVDFDNAQELRKKYGVTMQHTLVQIDEAGNQVHKWSGVAAEKLADTLQG